MLPRQVVKLPLQVEAARWSCPFSRRTIQACVGSREIVARALHGIEQAEVLRQPALLEQREHARRRADFQRGRERAHVRIADEQMQPAILAVIRQRLVARVDDRAVELHPLIDVVHDVIGTLADLEIDARFLLRKLEIERERVRLPHPARRR